MVLAQNWQTLIKPNGIRVVPDAAAKNQATLIIEPLERGFGLTLGNGLRRALLS